MPITTATPNLAADATRFGSGHAVRRVEDDALLKGEGRYTDDFAPAGVLCALALPARADSKHRRQQRQSHARRARRRDGG